jgi:hypothetical protein
MISDANESVCIGVPSNPGIGAVKVAGWNLGSQFQTPPSIPTTKPCTCRMKQCPVPLFIQASVLKSGLDEAVAYAPDDVSRLGLKRNELLNSG